MPYSVLPRLFRATVAATCLTVAAGCSMFKGMAVKTVANTLSETGDVFSGDNDPDLIRDAVPFGLKLNESLLASVPKHEPLLIATCSGFTQYAYGFVETEADVLGEARHDESKALRERALNLYLRARDYCLRAMDARSAGLSQRILSDPDAALAKLEKKDVPLLYWSAASWGAAIALGIDRPELVVDFPTVRALAERALALDETWGKGAVPELMISLDSLPEALGGNPERARQRFARAVEIQGGASASPYVSLATGVAVPAQNKAEFEKLLQQALAVDLGKDPSNRLANMLAQRRARALLDQIDTRFSQ